MTDTFQIGDATVTRIDELRWADTNPAVLYPDLDPAALAEHAGRLGAIPTIRAPAEWRRASTAGSCACRAAPC